MPLNFFSNSKPAAYQWLVSYSTLYCTVNTCKDLIPLTSLFNFSLRVFFHPALLLDLNRALVDAQPLCSRWDVDARYIEEFAAEC